MNQWTFGRKLAAGFGLVMLLVAAIGGVAAYSLRTVVASKDAVIDGDARDVMRARQLEALAETKVAISRGYLLTGKARYLNDLAGADKQMTELLRDMVVRQQGSEAHKLVLAIEPAARSHHDSLTRVIELRQKEGELGPVLGQFDREVVPALAALRAAIDTLREHQEKDLKASAAAASEVASSATLAVLALLAVVVIVGVFVSATLIRSLSRQIGSAVLNVTSSSAELQTSAGQQASSAKEQATSMAEVVTTIEELLATSEQIAEGARRVAHIATEATKTTEVGDSKVGGARHAMGDIKQRVDQIVEHMLDLGRKSQQIGGILEIINELAEQTNILAINATIEAAGAGEAGKRFAVVGGEIRKLADRVGSSTKEIRGLIEEIRESASTAVMATESGSKAVDEGTARFGEVTQAFSDIASMIETTSEAAREIELSTKQQISAVQQVKTAAAEVAQATKETETASAQNLQTASELTKLSTELASLVQPQTA